MNIFSKFKEVLYRIKVIIFRRFRALLYRARIEKIREMLIEDLIGYTGASRSEIIFKIKRAGGLLDEEWKKANPQTSEEIISFYTTCEAYLYQSGLLSPFEFGSKLKIINKSKGRVLDYGGGSGCMSLLLSKKLGITNITHYDVPSKTIEFVKWRFRKRGLPIIVIEGSEFKDKLNGLFDTIICLGVIEHLPNPMLHLKRLRKHLAPGGKLFVDVAFVPTPDGEWIHLYSKKPLKELLHEAGFVDEQFEIPHP